MSGMGAVVQHKSVVVVAGSGGVGKTTTSAAIAVQAALACDKRVLVVTVDPARRLADAISAGHIGDEPTRINEPAFAESGLKPKGELWAAMLDTKKAWDQLVHRHAPDAQTASRILENPLYQNISGRFVQSHDYIAMERLFELHEEGEYDLIVVDTPPSSHATDLLDAPARMAEFFDSRLLKFLVAPSKSRLAILTARPFLQLADRLLGKRFLADISAFFTLLETMRPGFIERAKQVQALLTSSECTFAVVTTLEAAAVHEAEALVSQLHERHLDLGAVVVNRALPAFLSGDAMAQAIASAGDSESPAIEGVENDRALRVLRELSANAARLKRLAEQQQRQSTDLAERASILATVPWLEGDLRRLEGLAGLGEKVW